MSAKYFTGDIKGRKSGLRIIAIVLLVSGIIWSGTWVYGYSEIPNEELDVIYEEMEEIPVVTPDLSYPSSKEQYEYETQKYESSENEISESEGRKDETSQKEASSSETTKNNSLKNEISGNEFVQDESSKNGTSESEPSKNNASKNEITWSNSVQKKTLKSETLGEESVKKETSKSETTENKQQQQMENEKNVAALEQAVIEERRNEDVLNIIKENKTNGDDLQEKKNVLLRKIEIIDECIQSISEKDIVSENYGSELYDNSNYDIMTDDKESYEYIQEDLDSMKHLSPKTLFLSVMVIVLAVFFVLAVAIFAGMHRIQKKCQGDKALDVYRNMTEILKGV